MQQKNYLADLDRALRNGDLSLAERSYREHAAQMRPGGGEVDVSSVLNSVHGAAGTTAFHAAAEHGDLRLCEWLLQNKADFMRRDKEGFLPVHNAACRGHLAVLELLGSIRGVLSKETNNGDTCLHLAAGYGKLECLEYLIQAGASIDHPNKGLCTPLHAAAGAGHGRIVSCLLGHGANPDAANAAGNTALHEACKSSFEPAIRNLLLGNADPSRKNNEGRTPLHVAARAELVGVVRLLMEHGADPTAEDNSGLSPGDVASSQGVRRALGLVADQPARTLPVTTPPVPPAPPPSSKSEGPAGAQSNRHGDGLAPHASSLQHSTLPVSNPHLSHDPSGGQPAAHGSSSSGHVTSMKNNNAPRLREFEAPNDTQMAASRTQASTHPLLINGSFATRAEPPMLDINELTNGVRKSFSNQSTLGKPARAPSPRLEPLVGAAANDASESASKHAAKQAFKAQLAHKKKMTQGSSRFMSRYGLHQGMLEH
mmetsp:Transcript_28448/g.54257  ORF Transcript_28448/g.54257 Transcript_28448/m.54257 type:complete len:484 (+) Transcript_28448:220-1671(+)